MSSTLISHRGTFKVLREDLYLYSPPEGTKTHKPIAHSELIETIENEARSRNYVISKEEFAIQRSGNILFGVIDLIPTVIDFSKVKRNLTPSIGIRTGNNKSFSIQLIAGNRVLVCDNLAFSGDIIALRRKHTSGLDLVDEVNKGFDRYEITLALWNETIDYMKCTWLKPLAGRQLIYNIFKEGIVPMKLFKDVAIQYEIIEHTLDNSLWTLHNIFTNQFKKLSPAIAFKSAIELGDIFEREKSY